jgi:hypothetical protein
MPWPGPPEPKPAGWDRCHFGSCQSKIGGRVVVHTPDRGAVPRFLCNEHAKMVAEAISMLIPVMVTPVTVEGASVLGGTVWINTISDFWFGKRSPFA